ncbi:MAG: hypothetical protein KBD78_15175, partial [Oligoflexales bacterium]|nr:hypothetical protein [Oligoflexales bacterium]
LSTLSKENKLSHYIDFNKDYYIVSNVKDPYDARVVLFGDRHESIRNTNAFFRKIPSTEAYNLEPKQHFSA